MITDRERHLMHIAVDAVSMHYEVFEGMETIDDWLSMKGEEVVSGFADRCVADEHQEQQDKIKSTNDALRNKGFSAAINEALK